MRSKRILPVLLAAILLLSSCRAVSESKPGAGSTGSESLSVTAPYSDTVS